MVTDDEREHAWGVVHDALAGMPGWAVGPCTFHAEVAPGWEAQSWTTDSVYPPASCPAP